MAHLYLTATEGPFTRGQTLALIGEEAHHASKVARIQVGEHILVSDGRGSRAHATVQTVSQGHVELEVREASIDTRPIPEVWLAQALAKGDRDEYAIQMACELGVDGVVPFAAARSVSVWTGEKRAKGQERWQKILHEATKQSLRAWIPPVKELSSAKELIQHYGSWNMVVMDPDAPTPLSSFDRAGDSPILMIVGPEGGLSPDELELFEKAGARSYRLGETVLRTSSAGPAALAVLNVRLGRW